MDDWIARHRHVWCTKAALRRYYESQIFAPLLAAIQGEGPVLEIGAGPGFLRAYLRDHGVLPVSIDIEAGSDADLVCDIHALPFASRQFSSVVGVDCLHHFAQPATALNEIARVLSPGGRLVLIEPWTGALGRIFYRFIHHEDCFRPEDPFRAAFHVGKSAMEGNAMIPKAVFCDSSETFAVAVPDLSLSRVTPFAGLSYLLTGGFQKWGFPVGVVMALARVEALLPDPVMRHMGLRAIFVLERRGRLDRAS